MKGILMAPLGFNQGGGFLTLLISLLKNSFENVSVKLIESQSYLAGVTTA